MERRPDLVSSFKGYLVEIKKGAPFGLIRRTWGSHFEISQAKVVYIAM